MKIFTALILLSTIFISGCFEEKVKPLQTTIEGLDLTKIQDENYFRQRMDASILFMKWCADTMIDPIPLDETTRMFNRNCQIVQHAVIFNPPNLEKNRKYKSY